MHNSQKKKIYTFSLEISNNLVYSIQAYSVLGHILSQMLCPHLQHLLLHLNCGGNLCMHFNCVFNHSGAFKRLQNPLLVSSWCIGLLAGISFALWRLPTLAFFTETVRIDRSPLLSIITATLPVLLTVWFLSTRRFSLLYLLLFIFAFCHTFCGVLLSFSFPGGSWLVRLLTLFSTGCTSAVLWFLLLRYQQGNGSLTKVDTRNAACVFCLSCGINIVFISPVLSALTYF